MFDYTCINIVSNAFLNCEFSMENLSLLIECSHSDMSIESDKIKYLGRENVVVSVKSKTVSKGIQKKSQLSNTVEVSYQIDKAHTHIRISKSNFHICGMKSIDMMYKRCSAFIGFLIDNETNAKKLLNDPKKDQFVDVILYASDGGKYNWYSSEYRERLFEICQKRDIDVDCLTLLHSCANNTTEEKLRENLVSIMSCNKIEGTDNYIYNIEPKIENFMINNGVYRFSIDTYGKGVILEELANYLNEKFYELAYNNTIDTKIDLVMPFTDDHIEELISMKYNIRTGEIVNVDLADEGDPGFIFKNTKKIKRHGFKITQDSKDTQNIGITQHSPCFLHMALREGKKLKSDIEKFIEYQLNDNGL